MHLLVILCKWNYSLFVVNTELLIQLLKEAIKFVTQMAHHIKAVSILHFM